MYVECVGTVRRAYFYASDMRLIKICIDCVHPITHKLGGNHKIIAQVLRWTGIAQTYDKIYLFHFKLYFFIHSTIYKRRKTIKVAND